ncbi:MAG: hypothetical protein KKH68_04650, partial [Proteobacteria bacterium]|nr:hypothetical protein [Pseudomonadota bacterium]
ERHEWEYSVTVIPLLIMFYGLWRILGGIRSNALNITLNWKQWLQVIAIAALLIVPVVINTYSPGWNAFLKQLPLIKSASNLFRWFIIYIPIVILAAVLALEKTAVSSKYQLAIVGISLVAAVSLNALTDRNFYVQRSYDPEEIVKSYYQVKGRLWIPGIKAIGINVDKKGQMKVLIKRNNLLTRGISQLYCYEALFGYQLEDFPVKSLHPGPAMEEKEGLLNIKNPACYVWPESNNCQPGDHFTVEQKKAAEAFASYRPYPFQMPAIQKTVNLVNGLALIAALLFYIFYVASAMYNYVRLILFSKHGGARTS